MPIRLLDVPLPIILPLVAQGVLPDFVAEGAPDWAMGLIAGVFLVVYVANMYGKMPGKPANSGLGVMRNGDRAMLAQVANETKKLTEMLAWRDDDGMERFPLAAKHAKESKELLEELLKLQESQNRHLETISRHLTRAE
jgi:hypothetical protein